MLEPAGDYLERKARELGLERGDILEKIQAWLDREYPDQVRAAGFNNQVLKLVTASAPLASELRLRQVELLNKFRDLAGPRYPINNLNIQISQL